MRYKEIGIGMSRTVRLEPYNVIRPDVHLVAEIGTGEDPDVVVSEMKRDLDGLLNELEEEEAVNQGFAKDETGKYVKCTNGG